MPESGEDEPMPAILPWLRRRWLRLSLLPMLLLLYAGFGFLLLPKLARDFATAYVERDLHRHLEIGEIGFNPFSFELRITALRLREADGAPLLGFDALLVNADPLRSLFARAITLAELRIEGPDIAVIVDKDGTLNLARLAPPATEPAAAPGAPQPLPRLHVGQFAVDGGRVLFEDRSRPQPFRLELMPIRFALTGFRTEAGHDNPYQFNAATAAGEQLEWSGDFGLQPFSSRGSFAVRQLQLRTLDDYLQSQLPLRLAGGSVELTGRYTLQLAPALSLDLELPSLQLRDLAVAERGNAAAPPVTLKNASLTALRLSLAQRRVDVGSVQLDGADITLRREADGRLNLARLAPAAGTAPAAATEQAPAAADDIQPWQVAVARIALADSRLRVEDRSTQPAARFTLAPVAASVEHFSTAADARLAVQAELGIDAKARLRAAGDVQLQPLAAQIKLDLAGFALPSVQPYLVPLTAARLRSGALSAQLQIGYAAQGQPQLRVAGDVQVADLGLSDPAGRQDLVSWRQLKIGQLAYTQGPDRLEIAAVTVQKPYARVEIGADRKLNISALMQPAAGAAPPERGPASKATPPSKSAVPMAIEVRRVRIDDGSAYFADRSIEPAFATGIVALSGEVLGISAAPRARATIALKGRVDRYSPVEISGITAPLAPTEDTDLRLSFRNIELSTFNPYSGKFAGYNIARGKLTTELHYQLKQRGLQAEHHVIVDQLEFGEATGSKDAAPLPVKLAASLLKDRHGVIDLNLPVQGSLDDPEFRYGAIVGKVLMNTLTKIVAAPFAALGSLFGGGEELAYVEFAAGSAVVDDAERSKLATLAKALIERPQLRLDVPMASTDADAEALAQAALVARLPADAGDDKARLRALERAYRELHGKAVRYPEQVETAAARLAHIEPLLRARLRPDAAALEALGRARAEAVQGLLLQDPALLAERIFIVGGKAAEPAADGRLRMPLQLK